MNKFRDFMRFSSTEIKNYIAYTSRYTKTFYDNNSIKRFIKGNVINEFLPIPKYYFRRMNSHCGYTYIIYACDTNMKPDIIRTYVIKGANHIKFAGIIHEFLYSHYNYEYVCIYDKDTNDIIIDTFETNLFIDILKDIDLKPLLYHCIYNVYNLYVSCNRIYKPNQLNEVQKKTISVPDTEIDIEEFDLKHLPFLYNKKREIMIPMNCRDENGGTINFSGDIFSFKKNKYKLYKYFLTDYVKLHIDRYDRKEGLMNFLGEQESVI